ncbi:MAG: DUF2865 domain-containing protein, partial [Fimbriimonadaceae bacterium]|nr:DUF2865 domain-containing protein [Alphaproteobacteria bacterium]
MSDRHSGRLNELTGRHAAAFRALVFSALAAVMTAAPVLVARAQTSQQCWALEQELAAASNVPRQESSQLRNLDRTIQRQRQELDKVRRQHAQYQCRKSGFFLFQPRQAPQCRTIQARMDQMTRNMASLNDERARLTRGDDADRDPVRLRILQALGRFNCGPQYRRYAPRGRTRYSLFGDPYGREQNSSPFDPRSGRRLLGDIPTYRTMCVRTCDGYRFPVSFATLPSRFEDDAAQCTAMCPTAETELYIHPNPGGSDEELTTVDGRNYSLLPNAWRYQTEVVQGCSCDATTLQLEASNANRQVVSIGADDSSPATETGSEVSEPGERDRSSGPDLPFRDTPTAELSIDFNAADPRITERAAGYPQGDQAAGQPASQVAGQAASETGGAPAKDIKMIEADDKPPFDEEADYHPNRSAGRNVPSDPK